VSSQPSKTYRFRNLEFWAEGGAVWVRDLEVSADSSAHMDDKCKCLPPATFMERVLGVWLAKSQYPDEAFAIDQYRRRAEEVVKRAMRQGDLTDKSVQDYHVRHAPKNRIFTGSAPNYRIEFPKCPDGRMDLSRLVFDGAKVVETPLIVPPR
jgi:hypothetical protein